MPPLSKRLSGLFIAPSCSFYRWKALQFKVRFYFLGRQIGMMRSGRLLAQESPANLLSQYRLESLEDVFLKLCMKDSIAQRPEAVQQESATYLDVSNHHAVNGHDNPAFEHGVVAPRRPEDFTGLNQLALVSSMSNFETPGSDVRFSRCPVTKEGHTKPRCQATKAESSAWRSVRRATT